MTQEPEKAEDSAGARPVQLKPRWAFVISMLWTLFFGALFLLAEPDEIGDPTDRLSYSLFTRLFSGVVYDGTAAADRIGVVQLDQTSLDSLNETWPPSFFTHANVLQTLLAYEPKAVFLDFLLVDRRDGNGLRQLVRVLQLYKDLGIPVFLAAGHPREHGSRFALEEIAELVTPVAGWSRRIEEQGLTYDLLPETALVTSEQEQVRGVDYPSAALALHRRLCEAGDRLPDEVCRLPADAVLRERPMWIMWPDRRPDYPKALGVGTEAAGQVFACRQQPANYSWLVDMFASAVAWFNPAARLAETCGPVLALPAQHVVLRSPEEGAPYVEAFRDRAIIYGFNLQGLQDLVDPPTTAAPIAGAFTHAAALENLLTFGGDYLSLTSAPSAPLPLSADSVELAALAMLILLHVGLVCLVSSRLGDDVTDERTRPSPAVPKTLGEMAYLKARRFRYLAGRWFTPRRLPLLAGLVLLVVLEYGLVIALLGAVGWFVEYRWLRIAPVNWIALISLFSVTVAVTVRIMLRKLAAYAHDTT